MPHAVPVQRNPTPSQERKLWMRREEPIRRSSAYDNFHARLISLSAWPRALLYARPGAFHVPYLHVLTHTGIQTSIW